MTTYKGLWEAGHSAFQKKDKQLAANFFAHAANQGEAEQHPERWKSFFYCAFLMQQQGHPDVKVQKDLYHRVIDLGKGDVWTYNTLAILHMGLQEDQEALIALDNAIEVFPDEPVSYYNKCCFYAKRSKNAEAFRWLEKAYANGYDNTYQVKKDQDLAAVRALPEFQNLEKAYDYENTEVEEIGKSFISHPERIRELRIYYFGRNNLQEGKL